jgi:hypothetical protein
MSESDQKAKIRIDLTLLPNWNTLNRVVAFEELKNYFVFGFQDLCYLAIYTKNKNEKRFVEE